jgi:hypothetical protein
VLSIIGGKVPSKTQKQAYDFQETINVVIDFEFSTATAATAAALCVNGERWRPPMRS